jgi:hypothetical protein
MFVVVCVCEYHSTSTYSSEVEHIVLHRCLTGLAGLGNPFMYPFLTPQTPSWG